MKDQYKYNKPKNKYMYIDNTDLSNLNYSSFDEGQSVDTGRPQQNNIDRNKFSYSIFEKEHRPYKKQNKAIKAILRMEDEFRKSRDWLDYYFYE